MSKKKSEPSQKLHNALYFMSGAMAVILVLIIVVGVKTKAQNAGRQDVADDVPQVEAPDAPAADANDGDQEKWQEGTITYEEAQYQYNHNIRTFLMMGIDTDEKVAKAKDYNSGGQSDAMFLLVVDSANQTLKVVSINRNTMTDIALCDEKGNDLGSVESQICLQHAFGDGKRLSCTRSVDAVSKLFGNIPISGYLAMNMGAIPQMNDAIGGVDVTVLQNITNKDRGVKLKKGKEVTLNGDEAYCYLRARDLDEYDSATDRMRRQEQYIVAYFDKLHTIAAGDSSRVVDVYDSIADYLVTSVDFTSLITELMNYDFSEDQMYTVPGETVIGEEQYEEYHVDEDAMQKLLIRIFYTPVEAADE